jgi:hypothetical protein
MEIPVATRAAPYGAFSTLAEENDAAGRMWVPMTTAATIPWCVLHVSTRRDIKKTEGGSLPPHYELGEVIVETIDAVGDSGCGFQC